MENFLQNIPLYISPIAFQIGFFSVGWYPLMYLIGLGVVFLLLIYRLKKKENDNFSLLSLTNLKLQNFLVYSLWGVLLGGRFGYVLYDFSYFWQHPIEIISPYDFQSGVWIGLYGMSFHGGLLGVIFTTWLFCRKNQFKFRDFSDFIIPALPAGYFFGRLGNFFNLELFGKKTELFWGMNFGDGLLRHPTQLYEALGEGIFLFIFLWLMRNENIFKGRFLFIYLLGYGLIRFMIDFLRESDGIYEYIFNIFSWSQAFSLAMIIVGIGGLVLIKKSKNDKING